MRRIGPVWSARSPSGADLYPRVIDPFAKHNDVGLYRASHTVRENGHLWLEYGPGRRPSLKQARQARVSSS